MSALTPADLEAAQKRTVATLVVAQAVGAVGITIGIATASLLARDISGSEEQAGLAQTFQVLGAAVSAYLLARLMSARGRRVGLATGYLIAAAGSLLAVVAGRHRLDAAPAGRCGPGRRRDGGEQRGAVRRHRPRHRGPARPGPVDGRVGDHDRRRPGAEPLRAGRRASRTRWGSRC